MSAGNGNAFLFPLLVKSNDETETHFHFHVHLPPKQKHISISMFRKLETETYFRFRLSLVNSAKNDPTKMGRAKLPATDGFARGQKTPTARGLEELFSAVLERFLQPIHDLCMYCKNWVGNTHKQ